MTLEELTLEKTIKDCKDLAATFGVMAGINVLYDDVRKELLDIANNLAEIKKNLEN